MLLPRSLELIFPSTKLRENEGGRDRDVMEMEYRGG